MEPVIIVGLSPARGKGLAENGPRLVQFTFLQIELPFSDVAR